MSDEGDIRVTLLGTGTSTGVPVIGCTCKVCTSADPRDKRLRCSCFVQANGVDILIDAGPDFRYQAMRAGIENVDAVLITHHHFDHVVGLDDLRPYLFQNRHAIPCYASESDAQHLRRMFAYIFEDGSYPGVPRLTLKAVQNAFSVAGRNQSTDEVTVIPVPADHGDISVYGYRLGRFAYVTDTNGIPEASLSLLQDLDVLVLDALRRRPHAKHLTIEQAVETAGKIGAGQTYFIHMSHTVLHAEEDALLTESMAFGYDGLSFSAGS